VGRQWQEEKKPRHGCSNRYRKLRLRLSHKAAQTLSGEVVVEKNPQAFSLEDVEELFDPSTPLEAFQQPYVERAARSLWKW
jgi:hypothetical protein